MRLGAWARLVASGNLDITLNCVPRIFGAILAASANSRLHLATDVICGNRIDGTEVAPPVFVIGHWRTGTTLLHELLAEDPALAAPSVYQAFFPSAFLAAPWLGSWLNSFIEPTRPFDNMRFRFDRPQEDEFAIVNLGLGSPYESLAYPRHGPRYDHIDIASLPRAERERWETGYVRLVRSFQLALAGKRLVLKSPLHTARIGVLQRLFPDARFIHVSRNPFEVFPSTVNAFRVMGSWQGLHNPGPSEAALREMAFSMLERIYAAYDRDRPLARAGSIVEIRYEDLIANPIETLRAVYQALELGGFAQAEPRMRANLEERRTYRRNEFTVTAADRAEIVQRWRPYFRRFGYPEAG